MTNILKPGEKVLVVDKNIYANPSDKLDIVGELPLIVKIAVQITYNEFDYMVTWEFKGWEATAWIFKDQIIPLSEIGKIGKLLYE